jgi:hypothetical protein
VDRLVARSAQQLIRPLAAEGGDRGRVGEPDEALGINDPDRLRGRLQHAGEQLIGVDVQAGDVGKG